MGVFTAIVLIQRVGITRFLLDIVSWRLGADKSYEVAALWCCTASRPGQAHAVLKGNHARGWGAGVHSPGDARLALQSPVT